MTREEALDKVLELKGLNWLLELSTGFGKSKLAIEKIKSISKSGENILIVVPRNIHKQNWADEIRKWWPECNLNIIYTTYVSFPKCTGKWDYAIFDEGHHLSDRCIEALCDFSIKHSIILSATINKEKKYRFAEIFRDIKILKISLRDAIDDNVLPDPKVYLVPLTLNSKEPTESLWKNKGARGRIIECSWAERWSYIRQKSYPVRIYCTEYQYMLDLDSEISYWKNLYMKTRKEYLKTKWLFLCGERLKYLSNKKNPFILKLLSMLSYNRTLTFCSSIEQTEILGKNCINSKNSESVRIYKEFNSGIINHITACNMLNESMNLVDCQVGIYANLNSSETIVKQRAGRLLRHPNPVIIIPYYRNTREEELVKKMLENYNPELVTTVNDLDDIVI